MYLFFCQFWKIQRKPSPYFSFSEFQKENLNPKPKTCLYQKTLPFYMYTFFFLFCYRFGYKHEWKKPWIGYTIKHFTSLWCPNIKDMGQSCQSAFFILYQPHCQTKVSNGSCYQSTCLKLIIKYLYTLILFLLSR